MSETKIDGESWPVAGDWLIFRGTNGYEAERKRALQFFPVGSIWQVKDISVEDFSHAISFHNMAGWWNGVMFERFDLQPHIDAAIARASQ